MKERRRYARIPENSQISYEVVPDEKASGYITKDIGKGGLRFLVHNFIPVNSHIKIRVTFQKTSFNFEAIARLVWIKKLTHEPGYEVGVEFVDLSQKTSKYLNDNL
ncbi:MAG: PilZ domain-containing protein [Candidatus Omnitrophota bacterium]